MHPHPNAGLSGSAEGAPTWFISTLLAISADQAPRLGICSSYLEMRPRMLIERDKDLKGSIHREPGLSYF